ncbi:MAG TPA: FMN-binding glutamate synthase family protein [Euryarchaeota archaeon]|nr:FMN-binding glutamate synthase family protein [Euryarchaeota archaeon]
MKNRLPQVPSSVRQAPFPEHRFFGRFRVERNQDCINCGTCIRMCPYGVHYRRDGWGKISRPRDWFCIGSECQMNSFFCVNNCPVNALNVKDNPMFDSLGDYRWPPYLIVSNWKQSESGLPPVGGIESEAGISGGGFDEIFIEFPEEPDSNVSPESVDLGVSLNRRNDGRDVEISVPFYGGGMSFGSIGIPIMLARARSSAAWNTFTCTGEGGYPDQLVPYKDYIITQIATGLFGVREETIQRARVVEFKYAQGAKPGLGGHLLWDKNTPEVARMREAVAWSSLFSPFPFHSVYSVEDHKKHLDWIRSINPKALISVKVSTPTDVDMVAVGSYYAGANIIHLDGGYGGTGAAPEIAKKNIAMPIEYAIPRVHRFLRSEGIRDEVVLVASGGIRTAYDILKSIALGADAVAIGTSELVSVGCVRCGNCESGRGCPRGIATTDTDLSTLIPADWGAQRIYNLFNSWVLQMRDALSRLGLRSVRELRGRTDLLSHAEHGKGVREIE